MRGPLMMMRGPEAAAGGRNLLTPNEASGSDTLGTITEWSYAGIAGLASSTDYAAAGSRSCRITTSSSTGRISLYGNDSLGNFPVTAGQVYTFVVSALQTSGTFATGAARMYWWTSAGNVAASTPVSSGSFFTLTADWQQYAVIANAPNDAAFVSVMWLRSGGGSSSMTRYEDNYGLFADDDPTWEMP